MSLIKDLWHERNRQADRAASAEAAGFPATAQRAREAADALERRARAAEAEGAPGFWSSRAHP